MIIRVSSASLSRQDPAEGISMYHKTSNPDMLPEKASFPSLCLEAEQERIAIF
jgi:hypothetical protein